MSEVNYKIFNTYEEQIEYLKNEYSIYVPNIISGQKVFFSDIYKWLEKFDEEIVFSTATVIFSDPTLNLALPYPYDEIRLAYTNSYKKEPTEDEVKNLFNEFSLEYELSKRPIISLSGGERLLLTFLKAYILENLSSKLIICSPTQWLNQSKYFLLSKLFSKYLENNKEIDCLVLKGEILPDSNYDLSPCESLNRNGRPKGIDWQLELSNLKTILEPIQFPQRAPSKTISYMPFSSKIILKSPTLLLGDNGIGKSVFAKILSGLNKYNEGTIKLTAGGTQGNARLLMQESVYQLFGESITNHIERVFKYDEAQKELSNDIYRSIDTSLRDAFKSESSFNENIIGNYENPTTLLQCKIALISERLASKPPLLILDELDWSLSSSISQIFLKAIAEEAFKNNVALLLISHFKNWWKDFVNSEIQMSFNIEKRQVEIRYENK